ncbi:MAG TPA: hypothetical protein P5280_06465, partial [Cyclobacteriaceae bacterium]|nr:hypothetical protein [Cyclobacteriaceae bacterium]
DEVASEHGQPAFDILGMFESDLRTSQAFQQAKEFIADYKTPRAVLMLGHHILTIHANRLSSQARVSLSQQPLISSKTVEQAIVVCRRNLLPN